MKRRTKIIKSPRRRIKIAVIVGARPNFMKAAPLLRAMRKYPELKPILVHTGQHYDFLMSEAFFRDLKMPKPDVYLGVGSMARGKPRIVRGKQIEAISASLRERFQKIQPRIVVVVGDVNSTLAAARSARALGIKVAHVEAGLRSGDLAMPEEINRIETDKISDFLFTTERSANENLRKEKIKGRIYFTGNTMIDSLKDVLPKIKKTSPPKTISLSPKKYAVLTLHRPSNVDDKKRLIKILDALNKALKRIGPAAETFKILFPVHPRTKKRVKELNLPARFGKDFFNGFIFSEPLRYARFIRLVKDAKFVITDSGGIQEETTYLGVPCLTLRDSTERPVTVKRGTNVLVKPGGAGFSGHLQKELGKIFAGKSKRGRVPEKWDGRTAERIVRILKKELLK